MHTMHPILSDWFRQELYNRQKAEDLNRIIDRNERLQKLMSRKTTGATDAVYKPGDLF